MEDLSQGWNGRLIVELEHASREVACGTGWASDVRQVGPWLEWKVKVATGSGATESKTDWFS